MDGGAAAETLNYTSLWLSGLIFVGTYLLLLSDRLHRTVVVMIGSCLMLLTGIIDQDEAVAGIDHNTIALLAGMMILVGITQKSGLFQFVAVWLAKRSRAQPRIILILLSLVTAVFSALFDNVTTVLLIVPVTLLIVEKLQVTPYPFLLAEIFSSNIGGTATLIGDPPNILIGSEVGFTFADFLSELGLVVIAIQIIVVAILYLFWRHKLTTSVECRERVMAFEEKDSIRDPLLLRQSLLVMGLMICGFLSADYFPFGSGSIAMIGATVLLLLYVLGKKNHDQTQRVQDVLAELEWSTLVFFIALFVLVQGVESSGMLSVLGDQLVHFTRGDSERMTFTILWLSAIASAVIDNIPLVATMIPLLGGTASGMGGGDALTPVWWALSLGACLGGNGSLIGATANVVVAGLAENSGNPIRFGRFLLVAFPIMLLSIVIATVYLYLRHFA